MTELSKELKAMAQVEAALNELDDEERARVMQWASARFGVIVKPGKKDNGEGSDAGDIDTTHYATLAELYDAAAPNTDADRALVAAYWFQIRQGAADVEAQAINAELKHMGHRVGNITRAFDALKFHRPAFIIQTRKEGTTKQARKRYKVTGEGKKAVEKLIANDND